MSDTPETSTATTTLPAGVTKDTIRGMISAAARKAAELRFNTQFPNQEQVKQTLKEITGIESLAQATAHANWAQKVECLGKLNDAIGTGGVSASHNPLDESAPRITNKVARKPGTPAPASNDQAALLAQLLANGQDHEARGRLDDMEAQVEGLTNSVDALALQIQGIDLTALNTEVASHKALLDMIGTKLGNVDQLLAAVTGQSNNKQWVGKAAVAVAAQTNPLMEKLAKRYVAGEESQSIIALCSPPGFGKSHIIRMLGRTYDHYLEHGCSPDSEEINIMLGSPTVRQNGNVLVADGTLTQAVRAAAAGANVLLFLDEIWRWAARTQEKFLTFTTGVRNADGTMVYRLSTRRVDDATESLEIIECPVSRLHIVAAGNLNKPPVEAFFSRFDVVRIKFTWDFAKQQAQTILDSFGVTAKSNNKGLARLADRFATAVANSRQMVAGSRLAYPVQFRVLVRAIPLSDGTEKSVAEIIKDRLADNTVAWDQLTGDAIADSEDAARELVSLFDIA